MARDDRTAAQAPPWQALLPRFAAWWWQPPDGAAPVAGAVPARSLLARRTAAAVQAASAAPDGFGEVTAWHWAGLALLSPAERWRCAGAYAALLMSQAPMLADRLGRLEPADRRWALAIGSIQPLPRRLDWAAHAAHDDAWLAFAELGFWLRDEFPRLWDRLLRDLDAGTRRDVAELMAAAPAPRTAGACPPSGMAGRVWRCWSLAQARTMQGGDARCDLEGPPHASHPHPHAGTPFLHPLAAEPA